MQELDNVLVSSKFGVLTQKDLEIAIQEYIDMMPEPEFIKTKVQCFDGLVRYLYRRCLKPIINRKPNKVIDYELLDTIFDNVYMPLCQLYGYIPNTVLFCNLCGITYSNISNINDNIYINNNSDSDSSSNEYSDNASIKRNEIIKKWRDSMESALVGQVANHSSIGSMFLLKSVYSYSENNTLKIDMTNDVPNIDTRQLSQVANIAIPDNAE